MNKHARTTERFTTNTTTQLRTSTRTFTYVYICKKQEEIKFILICDQDKSWIRTTHCLIKNIIWQNSVNIDLVRTRDSAKQDWKSIPTFSQIAFFKTFFFENMVFKNLFRMAFSKNFKIWSNSINMIQFDPIWSRLIQFDPNWSYLPKRCKIATFLTKGWQLTKLLLELGEQSSQLIMKMFYLQNTIVSRYDKNLQMSVTPWFLLCSVAREVTDDQS
jgi:hypothetical protein